MPRKPRASTRHAKAGSGEPVDVVIITAVKEEYDAVLEVETGAEPGSSWQRKEGPIGLEVAFRTFQGAKGGRLHVAVTRALEMGGVASVGALSPLVDAYAPRCLAMCGVCAGRKDKVELGDVIIANRLWTYDTGSLTPEQDESGQRVERVRGDTITYNLDPRWQQKAESFHPPGIDSWLALRPRSLDDQMNWVLERCLKEEDPIEHPDRVVRCVDWKKVLKLLWEKEWLQGETLKLTPQGRTHIQRELLQHRNRLPEPKSFQVHVGPIGTGSKVVRDPDIFEKLSTTMRTVLGLEMEASAIGALAHLRRVGHSIVMKGVMDFADPAKNDNFKHFAARASAECLLAFLREHLPTETEAEVDAPPPQEVAKAVAEYKRSRAREPDIRRLDLRGLVGIPQGPHETDLELLAVAVAPSLYQEVHATGSREARLHREAGVRDLEPEEWRTHQEQLSQLADERWSYHGERHGWSKSPIPFAVALRQRRFVVIGDPGAGKSVLTRLAFLACMEGRDGDQARALLSGDTYDADAREAIAKLRELLPVRLALGNFGKALEKNGALSLKAFIRRQLRELGARAVLRESLDTMLAGGHVFLLCDGLDEVPEAQRKHVVDAVESLVTRYKRVRFLLTSRPNGYWPRVHDIPHTLLAPLHYRQQRYLVATLHHLIETSRHANARDVERARRRTSALLRAITLESEWFKLSSNPLLLTLSALTPTDGDGAPLHRVFVFENFLQTLLGKWRFTLSETEAGRLLDTWASVASRLVLKQEHHSLEEDRLLELLGAAAGGERGSSSREAREALRLAFETGLIRREEKTILFWHRTFAEFLAAYALTRKRRGAAKRLLKNRHLPPLVLQLAAARLCLVPPTDYTELDALAEGLLARDETGVGRLLRPGLRAVSACLGDKVRFGQAIVERVWTSWAELLETTPPSPLWGDFDQLTQHALPSHPLPPVLLERFAGLDGRGVPEVQDWLARLLAPAAAEILEVRKACARWLEQRSDDTLRLHGAFGLASAGDWSNEVIDALGRFGRTSALAPGDIAERVKRGGPPLQARLHELVRMRLRSEVSFAPGGQRQSEQDSATERHDENRRSELRLSAACLLAIAGAWDDDVAKVLKMALSGQQGYSRDQEAKTVLRLLADDASVRKALVEWISADSTLGHHARELVKDVAPVVEGLSEAVLEQTAKASGRLLTELESLLGSIAEQQRSLTALLRSWLTAEQEGRRMCAARLLLRLQQNNEQLHDALRRGMRSSDALARVRWAYLALGHDPALSRTALATLQQCARSPAQEVRAAVYEGKPTLTRWLKHEPIDGWLACASDPSVPAAARLQAAELVASSQEGTEQVLPILHELLDANDVAVRLGAADHLLWCDEPPVRAATIAAEEAARANEREAFWRVLGRLTPFAAEAVRAVLKGLPQEKPPANPREGISLEWPLLLSRLVKEDLSSIPYLMHALECTDYASTVAEYTLLQLLLADETPAVGDALRERLERGASSTNPFILFRLVTMGFRHDSTRRSALEASRALEPHQLSQAQLASLADWLQDARAAEEATRLWQRVLEGDDPRRVLQAAGQLSWHHPEQARAWIQDPLVRVLDSPEDSLRLGAGHLALGCGILEEKAREALLGCIELSEEYEQGENTRWLLLAIDRRALASGLAGEARFERTDFLDRVDFEAMRVLCMYRPDACVQPLAAWLHAEEWERFTCGVRVLAARDDCREAVRAALLARLASAPDKQLEAITRLVSKYGLYSPGMEERVLERYDPASPSVYDVEPCLIWWLGACPELWSVLRQQPLDRRARLAHLVNRTPVSRDSVLFAVDFAIASAHYEDSDRMLKRLTEWCQPPSNQSPEREQDPEELSMDFLDSLEEELPTDSSEEELPTDSSEVVRGWIREALDGQAPPTDIDTILMFDSLATLGRLPAERRIELLRPALALAPTVSANEEHDNSWTLLDRKADVGLRLIGLKYQDEHLSPILEEAIHRAAKFHAARTYTLVNALLMLQPADAKLRQSLGRAAFAPWERLSLETMLDTLSKAGASEQERIDVLISCLGLDSHPRSDHSRWRFSAPDLFDALERLGCGLERRSALVREFLSTYGAKLSLATTLALAERARLSAPAIAKLLVGIIARGGWEAREAAERWLTDFASQSGHPGAGELRGLDDSRFLSLRLRSLARLSQVDDPGLLEMALAELAAATTPHLLSLYRRAQGGPPLSEQEWAELMNLLTLAPNDERVTGLAKEWLTLRLWQKMERSTVDTLLNS
ncbi:MAG TPA: hypothetical protein VFZ09_24905 [Archangium sp.]|uniref:hypothetical protein n=1 Tax=Archangium sp. TaxID=1872627 RepID=UPI002E31F58C|nr:hypothetical protein [Archangium sp.]HEX5749492.1 hypothetical protein [Archangium sp.]